MTTKEKETTEDEMFRIMVASDLMLLATFRLGAELDEIWNSQQLLKRGKK